MKVLTRGLAAFLWAAGFMLAAGQATAQSGAAYPTRSVKIVVTLPPGGSNDVIARLFAQKLSEEFKQPVVVENRPGGNSIPGADYVAKSAPDGYTLLFGNTTMLGIQPNLYSKLPYDPRRDFVPISVLCISAAVLVVHPALPARTVGELAALAKANPGKLNYASPGSGSPFHLSAELFKVLTGTDIVHVPYKGNAPALVDLIAGRVQFMFANVLEVLPSIKAGKLRPVATSAARRAPLLPEIPTLAEAGLKNAESFGWFVLVAPKDTPREIINTVNGGIIKTLGQPDVRQRLHELGVEPVGNSPEESEIFIRNENVKWANVIKASGAKVDN